jgi:hypothetical protein
MCFSPLRCKKKTVKKLFICFTVFYFLHRFQLCTIFIYFFSLFLVLKRRFKKQKYFRNVQKYSFGLNVLPDRFGHNTVTTVNAVKRLRSNNFKCKVFGCLLATLSAWMQFFRHLLPLLLLLPPSPPPPSSSDR